MARTCIVCDICSHSSREQAFPASLEKQRASRICDVTVVLFKENGTTSEECNF